MKKKGILISSTNAGLKDLGKALKQIKPAVKFKQVFVDESAFEDPNFDKQFAEAVPLREAKKRTIQNIRERGKSKGR